MTTNQPIPASGAELPEPYRRADTRIVAVAREIKILGQLAWPPEAQRTFLEAWRRGQAAPPAIRYPQISLTNELRELESALSEVPDSDPIGEYLHATGQSYITACRMLESIGTAGLCTRSIELYGRPGDSLAGGNVNNSDAAAHFLDVSGNYARGLDIEEEQESFSSEELADWLCTHIRKVFKEDLVEVAVDNNMVAKAAAGADRIRVRGNTRFSQETASQLLEHEAMVHTLTAINGRRQPILTCLGLAAPRTTATQEGLATFAELVTGTIDIARLNRIAMRIVAIGNALNGADFIDVFRLFLESGQDQTEAFYSAMRVFRGVPTTGGYAFTKDTVYLHGLMEVHTFFRWAMQHQQFELCRGLFAGRMTIGDVLRLREQFSNGVIATPRYLPPWMQRHTGLAAYLAFSVFANRIRIAELGEEYQFDRIDQVEQMDA